MTTESLTPAVQSAYRQLTTTIAVAQASADAHAKATHERFNVFSTLLKESDEVRLHTRFLHCLLDPNGTHDCGSLFLDLFFEMLEPLGVLDHSGNKVDFRNLSKCSDWSVRKEASSSHGQIDLLLERPRFGIAIENKINAGEQPEQLARYRNYLHGRHWNSFFLIYLTLDGKQACTARDYLYYRISYESHILHWLEACLRETYNIIPINQVIIQYRAVVRRLTHQTLDNEFMKPVLNYIRENPEILRHQATITQAVNTVRAEVLDNFAKELMVAVKEFAGDVMVNPDLKEGCFGSGPCGSLWITPHESSVLRALPFYIRLEVCGEMLLLGLKVPQGSQRLDQGTQSLLAEMNRFMSEEKGRAESFEPSPNQAWPTGWDIPVNPLNDGLIADWLRLGPAAEIDRVSKAVRDHIRLLERAYSTACNRASSAEMLNHPDPKITPP